MVHDLLLLFHSQWCDRNLFCRRVDDPLYGFSQFSLDIYTCLLNGHVSMRVGDMKYKLKMHVQRQYWQKIAAIPRVKKLRKDYVKERKKADKKHPYMSSKNVSRVWENDVTNLLFDSPSFMDSEDFLERKSNLLKEIHVNSVMELCAEVGIDVNDIKVWMSNDHWTFPKTWQDFMAKYTSNRLQHWILVHYREITYGRYGEYTTRKPLVALCDPHVVLLMSDSANITSTTTSKKVEKFVKFHAMDEETR